MVQVNIPSSPTHLDLRQEVDQLRQVRPQFARRLVEAADRLESSGFPPPANLIEELVAYRERMLAVCALLAGTADGVGTHLNLNDLEHLLEARDNRRSAEAVLEQLSELMHVDLPDFAPLVLCQREASRLCELSVEAGPELNSELELLRKERHPLNSLIRLCEAGDHMTDAEWTECHDDVVTTYGRQLATALTRGRIQRKPPREPGAVTVTSATGLPTVAKMSSVIEPVPPTSAIVTDVRSEAVSSLPPIAGNRAVLDSDSIFEPASETIFDVVPPAPGSGRLRMTSSTLDAMSGRSAVIPKVDLKSPASPRNGVDRGSTSDHIIRLMTEDRLPLAFHLTRSLEQQAETSDVMPPSWLLRSLILGRHLSYSKGDIARQLDDELREFRPEMLIDENQDRQLAMSFLLRAAALPGALLAGSAPAITILRAFKIAPGFSQLYNYCSRIALYGDRLAGSLVEMFRPTGTIAGASELDELSQSARQWLQEASRKAVTYTRTSPLFLHAHWTLMAGTAVRHADATTLWCKWQETLALAHRLLNPVCEQVEGERNWVRQEIARLTSQIRVEPLDQAFRLNQPSTQAGRGIVLPLEEMQAVILEAVAIANRWLRLCHQTSSGSGSPIPLEALELRDEIVKRSDGVLMELTQHRQTAASATVKASIACCQNVIRQIHAMFESRIPLPLVEPDPRHVLNADLLKIPGISLDDQWSPVTEASTVERELVSSLERTEMDWRQSYDVHAQAGNHEATGRLLELDVWSSADERESLQSLRRAQIADNRIAAEAELTELVSEITSIAQAGLWNEADCLPFQKRIERLRYELPRVLNFQVFRLQVNQLQSAILRYRSGSGPLSTSSDSDWPNLRRGVSAELQPVLNHSIDIFSGE